MWILGLLFMGLAASSFSGSGGDSDDEGSTPSFANDTEREDDTTTTDIVSEDGGLGILLEGGDSNNDLTAPPARTCWMAKTAVTPCADRMATTASTAVKVTTYSLAAVATTT